MRTFVLRARAAPTDSARLLASVGQEAHTEILAHTLMNAIFVAQSHRADVVVHLVLESTQDFSRTIRFEADAMHDIGGFDERALLGKVAKALDASRGMGKEETRPVESLLLKTRLGYVNDSMNPAGADDTREGVAVTSTLVGFGPSSTRASMRMPHFGEKSRRTPPPNSATHVVLPRYSTDAVSVSLMGTVPPIRKL